MSPVTIEKQQFKNNTGGWVGVVLIGPRGEDRGASVEPDGTVWLSEQEQVLTANAPRSPKDNPFIEQERPYTDPTTGEFTTRKVTPLTPVSENRFVPAQTRFVPGISDAAAPAHAQAAATGDEPEVVVAEHSDALTRHGEVAQQGEDAQPTIPARAAAASAAAHEAILHRQAGETGPLPEIPESASPPDATPLEAAPDRVPDTPPQEPQEGPQAGEEHAARVNPQVGEETGAAPPPSGPAPQGEYAQSEEVGTPASELGTSDAPPAPYVPPQE